MKIYKSRRGWQSAGFNITAISSFLSLAVVAVLIIGLINNSSSVGKPQEFNVFGTVIVLLVVLVIWVGSLFGLAYFMQNKPQKVTVGPDRVKVEGPEGPENEVLFSDILYVNTTQVPVKYLTYKASFRGLLVRYKKSPDSQSYDLILSEQNTCNFDELTKQLRALTPKPAYSRRKASDSTVISPPESVVTPEQAE